VAYSWTTDTTAPQITSVPAGGSLGCNPATGTLPTVSSVKALVTATDNCGGTPTINVVSVDTISGCVTTRTFAISATDACNNNSASTTVAYSWTTDTTAPQITSVPAGGSLGCNPATGTLPTASSVKALVTATDNCSGTPTINVTSADTISGCVTTRTFTITATDGCGNTSKGQTVTYTWTVDTAGPTLSGVPVGGNLGNNPATLPTVASITALVHATDNCSTPTISVTSTDTTSTTSCTITRTFTITAKDACGNTTTATAVYTWTTDTGPVVSCPGNVTIAINNTPVYCTFTPSDWCSSCNGQNTTPSWWVNWDQQNHGYNCISSFQNWYASCTGNNPGANCWNFCQTQQSDNNSHSFWWGGSYNQNSAPNWCASYNTGNPNNNWWVPCNGYNPGSVLVNCFSAVYPSGCVVGLAGGNCVKLTTTDAVRTCLGFSGTPNVLNTSAVNPGSCNAGLFCAQVLALQLNCDFGDAGASSGFGGPCGDLVYNDSTSPCNGQRVRDILKTANCVLGGGSAPSGCTASYLCGLCGNLNQCFEGCQVSSWCKSHLCPVYNPPPSQTGTATATSLCGGTPVLTYCDSVAAGSCPGFYIITRTWTAVDVASGMKGTCQQMITITPSPGPSISGTVVNDCAGAGCSAGNSPPNFSGAAGIANLTVTLNSSKGGLVATTTTDANGNFTFANPGTGNYTVVVTPPANYTMTYPTGGTANQTSVTITSACQVVNLTFAYMGNQTAVTLVKTASATTVACGGTITYTFTVQNTGNNCVTLSVNDPILGGIVFSQNSVAPGQQFTFTKTYTTKSSDIGTLVNTATATATPAAGPPKTATSSATTTVTTKPSPCSIYCNFNSQMPSSGWIWCNAHISANPKGPGDIHCSGATITITGKSGKTYTFPVPDCDIVFSSTCTTASSSFNGTQWTTTLPTAGDDEIFLAGCAIPCNPDYANAQNVCWSGTFTCTTPGTTFNWQWGAACYNNSTPQYSAIGVKACHQTPCGYNSNSGDHAGTPENQKPSCVGGGTGGGGSNWTGSWSSTGSCTLQACN
jgi:uncharacterized repeat protein (TIGR01451 family)